MHDIRSLAMFVLDEQSFVLDKQAIFQLIAD